MENILGSRIFHCEWGVERVRACRYAHHKEIGVSRMNWLEGVPNAQELLEECVECELIRFTNLFDTLLRESGLPRLIVLNQLKRSRRAEQNDYIKGIHEIPCYCFVSGEAEDCSALTFFVAFGEEYDGTVQVWMQEFHP